MTTITKEERMSLLGEAFGLSLPGLHPWDACRVEKSLGVLSSGEYQTAMFLLSVWNHHDFGSRFNMHEALHIWDDDRRAAFHAWTKRPWWA